MPYLMTPEDITRCVQARANTVRITELSRSVFSFYLEARLKGAADNDRDNREQKELTGFVRTP